MSTNSAMAVRDRVVLFHPGAGAFRSRRGGRLLRALRAQLGDEAEPLPGGDAAAAGRLAALDPERDLLVIAGGDGTLFHAVNLLAAAVGRDAEWPRLALVPAGTGNDAARSLAALVGRDLQDPATLAAAVARGDAGVRGDLGCLTWQGGERLFHNFAGFGAPVDWVRVADSRVLAPLKRLLPRLCYGLGSLAVLLRRRTLRLGVDSGEGMRFAELFSVFVANAPHLGGGMDLGAGARVDSGRLALLRVPAAGRLQLVRLLRDVKAGRGLALEAVDGVGVELPAAAVANLDGELVRLGAEPVRARVDVMPRRVRWI